MSDQVQLNKAIGNIFVPGKLVDITPTIEVVDNTWGLVNALGIFRNEMKSQKLVMINRTSDVDTLLEDRNWDERKNVMKRGEREYTTVAIPHFPVMDAVVPNDLDGNVDIEALFAGQISTPLTLQKVMSDKLLAMRKAAALTMEFARMRLIKDGSVYAPNGTVITNFYTEFGVTRETIYMDLASATQNPLGQTGEIFAQVQDSVLAGDTVTDIIALCSPEFFEALITNPFVTESYQYFAQPQGEAILNQRLGTRAPLDRRYRVFDYGGITFIEVRGGVGGERYVEAGKAYVFPRGTDSFRTFFAPANKFASINRPAQEVYAFTRAGDKDDIIELETETNFLNALVRPQIVITLDMAADPG